MVTFEPILVTVTAVEMEEERTRAPRDSYSSSVEIAFVIMDSDMMIPKFTYQQYVGEVRENSQPGTAVTFPDTTFLKSGLKGVFALRLEGDEGIFTVEPSVVRDSGDISIKVKNTALLDYEERPHIEFQMIARQVSGSGQSSSSAQLRVNLIDLNDNSPVFTQSVYRTEVYENITSGTSIIRVEARDADGGSFGTVRYTRLEGDMADRLELDAYSGLISRNNDILSFDRERKAELHLRVRATDNSGAGNEAHSNVILVLRDVNDEAPVFQHTVYQGVMKPDQTGLRSPIQVQAVDRDAEEPNNQVRYRLDPSSYSSYFSVDALTGELKVIQALSYPQVSSISDPRDQRTYDEEVINLSITAYDLGTPQQTQNVPVQIFREEFVERFITFIYPRPKIEVELKREEIETMLRTLTGGNAQIRTVEHFTTQDTSRSIVTALVRNNVNTVVDIEKILKQLNGTQPVACRLEGVQLTSVQGERDSYLAGVVILCVLLALIFLLIILCYMWSICPLYRVRKSRKVMADEGGPDSERVSYIRVDERGGYRGYEEERTWWDYLPACCTDAALYLGVTPPKRGGGRMAWSGDERQRYWQFGGGGEGVPVDERVIGSRRPGGRDLVLLEDLDEARLQQQQQQGGAGRVLRVDSRNSFTSQDPRRTFILRDARGLPRLPDTVREGEHYLVEDVDGSPRGVRMDDPRLRLEDPRTLRVEEPRPAPPPPPAAEEDSSYARPGNGEDLRLHASPPGAAPRDDGAAGRRGRPPRQAGGGPGGTGRRRGRGAHSGMRTRGAGKGGRGRRGQPPPSRRNDPNGGSRGRGARRGSRRAPPSNQDADTGGDEQPAGGRGQPLLQTRDAAVQATDPPGGGWWGTWEPRGLVQLGGAPVHAPGAARQLPLPAQQGFYYALRDQQGAYGGGRRAGGRRAPPRRHYLSSRGPPLLQPGRAPFPQPGWGGGGAAGPGVGSAWPGAARVTALPLPGDYRAGAGGRAAILVPAGVAGPPGPARR
ncbi:cadherin-86C-like isoform X2 [Scylla paramamosain]|uniref:cadherin-86C-like isoform X2 n=1 Tax=Scylla paramamosain TaxID=85552 RepID=UPI0030836812